MTKSPNQRWIPAAAAFAAGCLLLSSLGAFGIWDPWEVEISEIARGRSPAGGHGLQLGAWLVGQSFRVFGVHEWSGRLPIALFGLGLLVLTYRFCAAYGDRRSAVYATLIAATSPLFIFNAVTMLGEAPWLLLQSGIACCAMGALFAGSAGARATWLLALIALSVVGIASRGALLCVVPPLCAAAALALLEGQLRGSPERRAHAGAWVITAASLLLLAAVLRDAIADRTSYSIWLGGAPMGGQPPSFDAVIERTFHAFAPWGALLPLALGRLVVREQPASAAGTAEHRLALFSVLWVAFGYGALTLFLSRYGQRAALLPLLPMAIAVAMLLRDVERSRAGQWPAGIAAALLVLLVLRDYALYPSSPMHGLPVADISLPDGFNPKRWWAVVLVPFCVAAAFGFGHDPEQTAALDLRAPYRWLRQQWQRGLAFKLWLLAFAALLLGLEVFGVISFFPGPKRRLTTLAVKAARALMWAPVALVVLIAAVQLLTRAFAALRDRRFVPLLVTAVGIAGYTAFGFMPALGGQLSPRGVYDTYNNLAGPHETLAEYGVKSRAAAYYAKGKPLEIDTLPRLIDHLAAAERRWAVFPGEELTEVDRSFRQRTRRHLFVADDRNARAVLVSNHPVPGRADVNRLAQTVLFDAPPIASPLHVNFDDKVHLLGYALDLPHGDKVGQGESFEITWYFKAVRAVPGNYRVFVHIDAPGSRIGGDHDPIDGLYPVRLWSPGDIIVDKQRIEVSANSASGAYTIYMGLYSGDTRLPIKEGPHDPSDRAIAGVLRIR